MAVCFSVAYNLKSLFLLRFLHIFIIERKKVDNLMHSFLTE